MGQDTAPKISWFQAAISSAIYFVLKMIWSLCENALTGWADDQIASTLGIHSPAPRVVIEKLYDWGTPLVALVVLLAAYHFLHLRKTRKTGSSSAATKILLPETMARVREAPPNKWNVRLQNWYPAIIVLIIIVAIASFWPVKNNADSVSATENGLSPTKSPEVFYNIPLKMRDLFESDFSANYMVLWSYFEGTDPAGANYLKTNYALVFDYAAGTKFLSFYIPLCNEDVFKGALAHIVFDYQGMIDKIQSSVAVSGMQAGSTGRSSVKDALFSNQIYVYYENYLNLQQLAELEKSFSDRGISVHLRGRDYLAVHSNEKRRVVNGTIR